MSLFYKNKSTKVYLGDARKMPEIKVNSIDLIITSPPYWNLKNYKTSKQIGLGQSYEEYLVELEKVFKEGIRVLKDNRYFCLIIGTRISDGELKHIPADCISILKNLGLILKKELIWTKPKGTQGLWQRGVTQFLISKPYAREANFNIQHEFILIFKKDGTAINENFKKMSLKNKLDPQFIKEVAWSNWQIKVSGQKQHPAPFPLEIPLRLIKLYSYPQEVILDPFVGSGTTLVAAQYLNRNSVGYDISKKFCEISKNNLLQQGLSI